MSSESAFNKRLTEETKMDQVEGVLEHFNLPPKVIDFIRENQRLIVASLVVVLIAVVTWSLYSSYRKGVVQDAASMLSLALQEKGDSKITSLTNVVDKYGTTTSAQWAKIELAHQDMKNGAFAAAAEKYQQELEEFDTSSPLYPLLVFGTGQALEADKKYTDASAQYNILKEISGYEHIGYSGLARIEESQGNFKKAYTVYNNYLLNVGNEPSSAQARTAIEEQIARLKAKM